VSFGFSGGNGVGFNPDEPRDAHGRWTGSGSPSWQDKNLTDRSPAGRATALARHAYLSLPDRLRHRSRWPDERETSQLAGLVQSWNAARSLDDDEFRARYLGGWVSLEATRHLRAAAFGAARAGTNGEMAEAGRHLAAAITDIGVEDWSSVQRIAAEKAEAEDDDRKKLLQPVRNVQAEAETLAKLEEKPFGPFWLALTGAEVLDALDRWRERGAVEEALKKHDLDPDSAADVLAARAYVWAKNIAPTRFFWLPFSGPVSDAVAEVLMANELMHPGMLGEAEHGDKDAKAAIERIVLDTIERAAASPAEGDQPDHEPRECPAPEAKIEGMSEDARAYQEQITGLSPYTHMILYWVDFDGCDETTGDMLEAKAAYEQFLNKDGTDWQSWFKESRKSGWPALERKELAQNWAAFLAGRHVEFHFAEERVAILVKKLFKEMNLKNTTVTYTPRKQPSILNRRTP
jgi:hypothetical protein